MWEQDNKFIDEILSQIEMPNKHLNFDLEDKEYFSLTKEQQIICFQKPVSAQELYYLQHSRIRSNTAKNTLW